ncbi:7140_t:CDS:2 [Dentiscutata erythropus]|uniref:7140_t:CDS:1 n=1 Tax=Dentiscutata erythropus TaxID=1348616 RepID=A0A9N9AL74_9GLOM|nr:7140_t:CDS:2 [Dentiscutata erythropus]
MWALSQRSMSIDEESQDPLIFGKNSLVNLDTIVKENSESGIPYSTTSNLLSKHIGEPTDKILSKKQKQTKKELHILKDFIKATCSPPYIKELSTKPKVLQDPVTRKENAVYFNDLYNNIIYTETQNEIINQEVITSYYLLGKALENRSLSATKRHFSDLNNYEEEQQENVKKIRSYPGLSFFALLNNLIDHHVKDKQLLIYCPPECVGPLVQIYYNVFSQFLHDYLNEDLGMGREYYQWALEFIYKMAEIYTSESDHLIEFNEKIRELFGEELRTIHLEDNSSNDEVLECNVFSKSILRFFVEMKNEIGTGSCNSTVQAGASFAKYYTQKTYGEKPIIDPLMDFIPLIPTNNRAHAERVARLFKALHLGVNRLKEYYLSLDKPISQPNLQRFFPYPNQYEHQGITVKFTYEAKLLDHKLLWKAITKDGQKIIVKFAWQYNQRAHELCSKIGKVPKLLYINKEMVDGFYMIVMDYVEATPLYNCNSLSYDEYKTILENIKEAIDILYKENIMFADLCDSNIFVNKSQDFDWASQEEIECYPYFMNHKHINWPPGAEDRKKLSRKHDVYWLELLKSKYLEQSSAVDRMALSFGQTQNEEEAMPVGMVPTVDEMVDFLDKAYKKNISNEIRERRWRKKLLQTNNTFTSQIEDLS